MISVSDAQNEIFQNTYALPPIKMDLADAFGLVLSKDVFAQYDIPAYPQSSMDGYAFAFNDVDQQLKITGVMAAGSTTSFQIGRLEASRIFTGAPLPAGADTVVMQEKVDVSGGKLKIKDPTIAPGANVRARGAEIKAGELALEAGAVISVSAMGFLAGIGISEVEVFAPPQVSIILTGNELQPPGQLLSFGKVFDSNSYALSAAVKLAGVKALTVLRSEDDVEKMRAILEKALQQSDIVLLTGGVSVGDFDYVTKAAALCGIETRFHRIRQKPGKPLFFGTKDKKLVFGLPGNPSSALTCFYVYVLPAIHRMMNRTLSQYETGFLTKNYRKIQGLTQFMKARLEGGSVTLLHAQESFRMASFAVANCIAILNEEIEEYHAGDQIKVILLPG